MRKYEISCAIIIQNMAQLETMYKESWKTIVGNCDEFIYLGGHESSSTEYVSKMLGKQTIKSRNSSKTYGRQGSSNISLNATGRELMTPDEIAHMSDQDCLVMVKGVMPFFDKKYDLLKHPNYQYTGDADDDLLFDIAAEIKTPQNNVFGNKNQAERRKLEHQAKDETRTTDRRAPFANRRKSVMAINPENLEKAGFYNKGEDYNNVYNQDESMYVGIEVDGAHAPADEYTISPEIEAESTESFNSFLDEEAPAPVGENEAAAEGPMEEPEGITEDILAGAHGRLFTNHLKPLNNVEFVVLDIETTGVGADDEIVELSFVDKNGVLLYSSLFRNQKPLDPQMAEVNQLDADTLSEEPLFADEWERIKLALNGKRIISFNTDFDYRLFKQTLARYDMDAAEVDMLFEGHMDAMKIYLDIRPNGRNKISLQSCCEALGMNAKETHRAVDDCRLTLDMLKHVDRVITNAPSLNYLEGLGLATVQH